MSSSFMQKCHLNGVGTGLPIWLFEAYQAGQWTQNRQMSADLRLTQMHAMREQKTQLPMSVAGALLHPYKSWLVWQ